MKTRFRTKFLSRLGLGAILVVWCFGTSSFAQQPLPLNRPKDEQVKPNQREAARPMLDSLMRSPVESRLLAAALDLTDDQQRRILEIRREFGPKMAVLWNDAKTKRLALDEVLFSTEFNEENVLQRARELAEVQGRLVVMQTQVQARIRQLLTAEQVNKFLELREDIGTVRPKDLKRELRRR